VAAFCISSLSQRRSVARLSATLVQAHDKNRIKRIDFPSVAGLPAPAARYFRLVLREGQTHIRVARFHQRGELRTDVRSRRWFSFAATHTVSPLSLGFVWNARVQLMPLFHIRVVDAYVAGEGSSRVNLLPALTIASQSSGFETNSGSLHRYLAEAVWLPDGTATQRGFALECDQ
jgi:hypothetical protein